MSKKQSLLKVFIASPSDVAAERDVAIKAIQEVNEILENLQKPYALRSQAWEHNVFPDVGLPEDRIQNQILATECDIFIGVFWKRFGPPPSATNLPKEKPFLSGTEEEIAVALDARKRRIDKRPIVMLYRKTDPFKPSNEREVKQYNRVAKFFDETIPSGRYSALAVPFVKREFKSKLRNDLLKAIAELENKEKTLTLGNLGYKSAQLTIVLEQDIQRFKQKEKETLISAIARIVNIDPKQIRVLQISEGSIHIILEMPEESAHKLLSLFMLKDPVLTTLNITKVEIQHAENSLHQIESILFLAADPTDASRIRLGEELREIQEKLRLAKLRESFVLNERMSVRPADVSQALLDLHPNIVHFSGHGAPTGAIYFENKVGTMQKVSPKALSTLFAQFASQVKVVILNACYSGMQAKAIAKHVDYVIGMNKEIGDNAAIAFSIGFYQGLGAGRTIEDSYKLGVTQIMLQDIPEYLTPKLITKKQ